MRNIARSQTGQPDAVSSLCDGLLIRRTIARHSPIMDQW